MSRESAGVEPVSSAAEAALLRELERVLRNDGPRARLVTDTGESYALPDVVWNVLTDVVREMALGNAVALPTARRELTTQQAAQVLGVSRPYLIGLLESGRIPFRKVGTHRRVALTDVLAFRERERARQQAAMDRLVALSLDAGLEI